jgi:uncharacterized protein (DUF2249 family)
MGKLTFILLIVLSISAFSCSSNVQNPVNTSERSDDIVPLSQLDIKNSSHYLLGSWTLDFNIQNSIVTVNRSRTLSEHYNVTDLFPDPVIEMNSYDPASHVLDVEFALHNPYLISIYDVRVIIFTDAEGHELINADDWITLYDIPEGMNVNPFKAFCKLKQRREFMGMEWNSENLKIRCPDDNFNIKFAIDACYPGNCEEPYEIVDFSHMHLWTEIGSSGLAEVTVRDWQSDVDSVLLCCPAVTGTSFVPFNQVTTDKWSLTLTNATGAHPREYPGYIVASSANSGNIDLYDKITILVETFNISYHSVVWDTGYSHDTGIAAIEMDSEKNIYLAGKFFITEFDSDPSDEVELHQLKGGYDIFIMKLNRAGEYYWCKTIGSVHHDSALGMSIDSQDNILLGGYFEGTMDFDPGPGVYELPVSANSDAFVAKYTKNGDFVWAKSWSSSDWHGYQACSDVAVDSSDSVYAVGNFNFTTDFDPGPGEYLRTSNGMDDACVVKYASDGEYQWVKAWGGARSDSARKIQYNEPGYFYIGGWFDPPVDLDPGPPVYELNDGTGFISRFSANGDFIWAVGTERLNDLAADPSQVVMNCGGFWGTTDFDKGPGEDIHTSEGNTDCFASAFDSFGQYIGTYVWGGTGNESFGSIAVGPQYIYISSTSCMRRFRRNYTYFDQINWWSGISEGPLFSDMLVGDNNRIYATGWFNRSDDLDPGPETDAYDFFGMFLIILKS